MIERMCSNRLSPSSRFRPEPKQPHKPHRIVHESLVQPSQSCKKPGCGHDLWALWVEICATWNLTKFQLAAVYQRRTDFKRTSNKTSSACIIRWMKIFRIQLSLCELSLIHNVHLAFHNLVSYHTSLRPENESLYGLPAEPSFVYRTGSACTETAWEMEVMTWMLF